MKKLMFGLAAMVAGSVMAIESENVVGYQQANIADEAHGGYTWLLSTLPDVGKSASELTLASWKVTPPTGGLVSATSVYVTTFNAAGQIEGGYVYLDAESNGMDFGAKSGWYTAESVEAWDPIAADATIIPFGVGVQIGSDCGAIITFAGQVQSVNTDIVINSEDLGGYTWTGNCSPIDLTFADIAVVAPEGGFVSATSVYVTTFNAAGQIEGGYVYLDAESNGMDFGAETGWYTAESVEAWDPIPAGTVGIKAGEMFQVGSDCGATISIPSPLK